jgi:mono/diheme cytochrome c family protein
MRGSLRALLALAFGCASSACQHSSADAESIQSGERIFASVCSRCHGVDGKGGIAAGGANAPRNFCDAAFQASRSDADLMQVIQKGKASMPAFGNLFSDSDLRGLVHKLRSFTPTAAAPSIDPGKGH